MRERDGYGCTRNRTHESPAVFFGSAEQELEERAALTSEGAVVPRVWTPDIALPERVEVVKDEPGERGRVDEASEMLALLSPPRGVDAARRRLGVMAPSARFMAQQHSEAQVVIRVTERSDRVRSNDTLTLTLAALHQGR